MIGTSHDMGACAFDCIQTSANIFDWEVRHYSSHLEDTDLLSRMQAKNMLKQSARLYCLIYDDYSPFFVNLGSEFLSRRERAESLLKQLDQKHEGEQ